MESNNKQTTALIWELSFFAVRWPSLQFTSSGTGIDQGASLKIQVKFVKISKFKFFWVFIREVRVLFFFLLWPRAHFQLIKHQTHQWARFRRDLRARSFFWTIPPGHFCQPSACDFFNSIGWRRLYIASLEFPTSVETLNQFPSASQDRLLIVQTKKTRSCRHWGGRLDFRFWPLS